MTVPVRISTQESSGSLMESVLVKGDLAKLTSDERARYYTAVCHSMGLNPLTNPFSYIVLNGKLTLYATRTCTDQLRKINGVSIEIVSRDVADGILTVHVRAKLPDGRADEDLGSVNFPETLKGEARANAELKAVTKAKRRATLSICGLGWLDETEVEDIPANAKRENPHVTKPEDITDPIEYDDNGDPVDNIPRGAYQIERMSKSMARPEYALCQTEIRSMKNLPDLMNWGQRNANRVKSLPTDWQEMLRGVFRDQMIDLGWAKEAQP